MSTDLTNKRFGRLVALKKTDKRISNRVVWLCQCDCGNQVEVTSSHLNSGQTTSCGCARAGANRIDLTGRRYGRLVVLSQTTKRSGNSVIWHCQCDCGKMADVAAIRLTTGTTKSCGCLSAEVHREASATMRNVRAVDYVDGTDVRNLLQAPSAANTSGTVGVTYDKSVRAWKAYIQFKGHRYYLGSSVDKPAAVAMRKAAEQRIHGDFLEWYYSEHPERNPNSAEKDDNMEDDPNDK